ncbi:hypothetical protein [Nocardiopsis coralliicola]
MHVMLELIGTPRPSDAAPRSTRQERRLSARRVRAELRERERQEHAMAEIAWSRLC